MRMLADVLLALVLAALVIVPPFLSRGGWVICDHCDKDGLVPHPSGRRQACPRCAGLKGWRR